MRKTTKRSAIIAAVAVVAVGAGAAAWAANGWTVGGTGTGDASAATIAPLTATSDMGTTSVYPGLVTRMFVNVQNSNDFPVKLTGDNVVPKSVIVTGTSGAAQPAGQDAAACKTALETLADGLVANFDAGSVVPKKGNANVPSTVKVGDIPQACVGTHIKVTYTFNATSSA